MEGLVRIDITDSQNFSRKIFGDVIQKKFESVTCTITSKTIQDNLANGISPDKNNWKIISKLAARTFVPESEESRIKGAGGSDDAND